MKLLTHCQARWLEYLNAFNMVIRFRPRHLGAKSDALTCHWDVYLKERGSGYANINSHNFKPIFTSEHLVASLRATILAAPILQAMVIIDIEQLYENICKALPDNSLATSTLFSSLLPLH